jgi:nitrogen fixation NifU-like protein
MKAEIIKDSSVNEEQEKDENDSIKRLLIDSGYSEKAIDYYLRRPHFGEIPNADIVAELTGSCGDKMKIYIDTANGIVSNAKFQVMGCAGAITSAMAVVDLIKGNSLEFAKSIDDGKVFHVLEKVPVEKHQCIQLAVKTLHKALNNAGIVKVDYNHPLVRPST